MREVPALPASRAGLHPAYCSLLAPQLSGLSLALLPYSGDHNY
jgi:hypothetical protein